MEKRTFQMLHTPLFRPSEGIIINFDTLIALAYRKRCVLSPGPWRYAWDTTKN